MMKFRNFTIIAIVATFFFTLAAFADSNKEVKIKTGGVTCTGCKAKIEKALLKVDGVKSAKLNMDDKFVTVNYSDDKTNPDALRSSIAKVGFDADNVKAGDASCDKSKCSTKAGKDGCCTSKGKKAKSSCTNEKSKS